MKKAAIYVATLVISAAIAFFAGHLGQQIVADALAEELAATRAHAAATEERLRSEGELARLHSQLGLLMLEVDAQNYGRARERSTRFFDAVQDLLTRVGDPTVKHALETVAGNRDDFTAELAAADRDASVRLKGLYVEVAKALDLE
jgi:hypothetical protein